MTADQTINADCRRIEGQQQCIEVLPRRSEVYDIELTIDCAGESGEGDHRTPQALQRIHIENNKHAHHRDRVPPLEGWS